MFIKIGLPVSNIFWTFYMTSCHDNLSCHLIMIKPQSKRRMQLWIGPVEPLGERCYENWKTTTAQCFHQMN